MPLCKTFIFSIFCNLIVINVFGQEDGMIRTTDGRAIATKNSFITECKKMYGIKAGDSLVTQVCECQVNQLNDYFTTRQLGFYQSRYKEKALRVLIEQDPVIQKKLRDCAAPADHLLLVASPFTRKLEIKQCIENLKKQSIKPLNDTLATRFCGCAADIMQKRKLTAERIEELTDPSSFLFNEIAYQCGSPFLNTSDYVREWNAGDSADIIGSITADSVSVISILGMHKIKITIGGITKVWMIDSGASDLLISEAYAKELKEKGVISEMNYAGEGLYTLANNSTILCKKYKINGLQIGRFVLNNVMLATAKEAKELLLGKSVLNKFTQWSLNNKHNILILKK